MRCRYNDMSGKQAQTRAWRKCESPHAKMDGVLQQRRRPDAGGVDAGGHRTGMRATAQAARPRSARGDVRPMFQRSHRQDSGAIAASAGRSTGGCTAIAIAISRTMIALAAVCWVPNYASGGQSSLSQGSKRHDRLTVGCVDLSEAARPAVPANRDSVPSRLTGIEPRGVPARWAEWLPSSTLESGGVQAPTHRKSAEATGTSPC